MDGIGAFSQSPCLVLLLAVLMEADAAELLLVVFNVVIIEISGCGTLSGP